MRRYDKMFYMKQKKRIRREKPLDERKVSNFNMRLTQSDYKLIMDHFGSSSKVREFLLEAIRREHERS